MNRFFLRRGFTLIEILVVISIIGILTAILTVNFNTAREGARDDARKAGLKELQLALEVYKAQYGQYPDQGCGDTSNWTSPGPGGERGIGSCANYIDGLVPEFMPELPTDPNRENELSYGYMYRVSPTNDAYKVIVFRSVEAKQINSYDDEFARCPRQFPSGGCSGANPPQTSYAVYSAGAEDW